MNLSVYPIVSFAPQDASDVPRRIRTLYAKLFIINNLQESVLRNLPAYVAICARDCSQREDFLSRNQLLLTSGGLPSGAGTSFYSVREVQRRPPDWKLEQY